MARAEDTEVGKLKEHAFLPSLPARGAVIFLHGHGDYSSRYEEILEPFLSRGLHCISTDLPGHGGSPGKRGFVPDLDCIDRIVRSNLTRARDLCPEGPIGLIGHSVGGLLALRELLKPQHDYHFAWISSPLLHPESTRHPLVVAFLRALSKFFPGIALDTGVRGASCRQFDDELEQEKWTCGPFHSQISLRWGCDLITAAREVRRGFALHPAPLPLLFTQGSADPVCSADSLRLFLQASNFPNATHLEFEDQLHEPFVDYDRHKVRAAIGHWLDRILKIPNAE